MRFCHWAEFSRIRQERTRESPVGLPKGVNKREGIVTEMRGSSAGRWVHIYKILFKAFKAFCFKSSAEFGNL